MKLKSLGPTAVETSELGRQVHGELYLQLTGHDDGPKDVAEQAADAFDPTSVKATSNARLSRLGIHYIFAINSLPKCSE